MDSGSERLMMPRLIWIGLSSWTFSRTRACELAAELPFGPIVAALADSPPPITDRETHGVDRNGGQSRQWHTQAVVEQRVLARSMQITHQQRQRRYAQRVVRARDHVDGVALLMRAER
jgi:hypothetical protein